MMVLLYFPQRFQNYLMDEEFQDNGQVERVVKRFGHVRCAELHGEDAQAPFSDEIGSCGRSLAALIASSARLVCAGRRG